MNLTGLSRAAVAGTLELLWLFAMEQAPAGDVGRWTNEDLEAELDWVGTPGKLIEALVETRWLDRCAVHRLVIHDWHEHLPEYLSKRVDRGSLILAIVSPCQDNGGRCPPAADDGVRQNEVSAAGGVREATPRHAEPSEAPPSEGPAPAAAPPPPAPVKSKAKRRTRVPDQLEPGDRDQVIGWAGRQNPPISNHALTYAWKVYLSKARASGYKYEDHARAFMNALGAAGEAWALKGYEPPSGPGGSRYRSADDVLAEAKRKQAEDDARAKESPPDDPVAIAAEIERSLRPALSLVRLPASSEAINA